MCGWGPDNRILFETIIQISQETETMRQEKTQCFVHEK